MSDYWFLSVWAIGAAAVLAFSWPEPNWREVGLIFLLALLWPLVAAVIIMGMALDFAKFLIAVTRKPH